MLLQLFDRGERCAVQRLALKDGKPSLDPIEPRRPRRGEMWKWTFGCFLSFLSGSELQRLMDSSIRCSKGMQHLAEHCWMGRTTSQQTRCGKWRPELCGPAC